MKRDSQQKKRVDKLKKWECKGCDKKYSSESSLYNHIDIKHPGVNKKEFIKNEFLNKIGRPKKEKNKPQIDQEEESKMENNSQSELILGFYKNKLWVQFLLEFKDYIKGSVSNSEAEMNSQYGLIKNYVNQLEDQYNDISYPLTEKEKDDFIQQVDMFSQSLKNNDNGNIWKAIVLFYLMNISMESQFQKVLFHQLQYIDQEILNKVCKVFCNVNDSKYGQCKYQEFVQETQQQFY
ncbi:hypothetical protein ABPG72_004236 [Tetrahymena utriculariae]